VRPLHHDVKRGNHLFQLGSRLIVFETGVRDISTVGETFMRQVPHTVSIKCLVAQIQSSVIGQRSREELVKS